ncbi:MAG: zinc-binding dehydrogenase [Streptosporangiales bacterium]|nr:zinc-binding dehydrogenase [Streptosporangiales bacterium]
MFAISVTDFNDADPLAGLTLDERPAPADRPGWTAVTVRAASLNQHDIWSLRGVGLGADELPRVLGCDVAGVDEDGDDVVAHSVIPSDDWLGDETLDPKRSLLSERYDGTFAEQVLVPRRNLLAKPATLSFTEAACLPTAWLTAYRMLFTNSGLQPGGSVLVQGAGGGVATALIVLARAAGLRVFATSRSDAKRKRAVELGAHEAFESGARLPMRVDAVMETVGKATWSHSVKCLRPGGRIVVSGATTGPDPSAELQRVFYTQLSVIGSTMGDRSELQQLLSFLDVTGARPAIDRELPMSSARDGFQAMLDGDLFGKIVFTLD